MEECEWGFRFSKSFSKVDVVPGNTFAALPSSLQVAARLCLCGHLLLACHVALDQGAFLKHKLGSVAGMRSVHAKEHCTIQWFANGDLVQWTMA